MNKMLVPDTYTAAEAAQLLNLHLDHVRRLFRGGRVPGAFRDNRGAWTIPRQDLNRYAAACAIFRATKDA
mgnify:CR=1 FL=1